MPVRPGDRALVTGAASGLGLALVKQLVRRGARVLATDVGAERPASLDEAPGVDYLRLDVTSEDDWAAAQAWVRETWKGLDLLFNNAGVAAGGRLEYTTLEDWRWIIDINLLGVVRGCREFTPMLKAQRTGQIVNTASAAGLVHPARMTEYVAVKAGVVALSESLGYELAPYGVGVSVVCPTFFKTNLSSSLRGKDPSAKASAGKLIDNSSVTADSIAAAVMKGVDARRAVILTDRPGRVAWYAKRVARPVYDAMQRKASVRMASKD